MARFTPLGETLAALARQRGLSTSALADRAGLDISTVASVLTGGGNFASADQLARALGRRIRINYVRRRKVHTGAWLAEQSGLAHVTATRVLYALGGLSGGTMPSAVPEDVDLSDLASIHCATIDLALETLGGHYTLQ